MAVALHAPTTAPTAPPVPPLGTPPPPSPFATISPTFQSNMDTSGFSGLNTMPGPATGSGPTGIGGDVPGPTTGGPGLSGVGGNTPSTVGGALAGLESNQTDMNALNVLSAVLSGIPGPVNPFSITNLAFRGFKAVADQNLRNFINQKMSLEIDDLDDPNLNPDPITNIDSEIAQVNIEQGLNDEGLGLGLNDTSPPAESATGLNDMGLGLGLNDTSGVGGGTGEPGTVVCSELHRQGLLGGELWQADQRAGTLIQRKDPNLYQGYLMIGLPLACLMAKSAMVTKLVAPFALAFARKMAGQPTVLGTVILWAAPAVRLLGWLRRIYEDRLAFAVGGRLVHRV